MTVPQLLASVATQGVELWVEGSRLRFRGPRGALSAELRRELTAHRPEVVGELRARAAVAVRLTPLSHNQRALWFVAQEAPASAAYNLSATSHILSAVDPATIREALQALTDRHAMLRTTYVLGEDSQPMQRTVGAIDVAFDVHQVPGLSDTDLRDRVEADYRRPFDLEHGPVFRTSLYTRGAEDHVLMLVVHHIAADAWSLGVLSKDFLVLHTEAAGRPATVPSRDERGYLDFVEWQARMLASPAGEGLARYWQAKLHPAPASLDLPGDRPRPPRKSSRGATRATVTRRDLLTGLRALARDHGTSLYVVLLAAFDAMLFRLTGSEDLVVGTPTFGRTQDEFSRAVGYFVNPVPIRVAVQPGMTFRELIARARVAVHEALDHQDYPLSLMVQRTNAVRDASRSPLFETFFSSVSIDQLRTFANASIEGTPADPNGLRYEPFPIHQLEGQFDLAVHVAEHEQTLEIEFRYSTDLFDVATADGMLHHYVALLESGMIDADVPVEALGKRQDAHPTPSSAAADSQGESIHAFLAELDARDIRLTLDGEKLKLNAPAGVLDGSLKARLASRKADIIAALGAASATVALTPVARTPPLPVSFAQQRLWFLDRMQPGNFHYNIGLTLRLLGALDRRALVAALESLIRRHEVLRTGIRDEEGMPSAHVRETVPPAVQGVDLSNEPADGREAHAARLILARGREPFDLANGPMARFLLIRLAPEKHLLLISMHHIAADGWSLSVAVREIQAVYEAEVDGRPSPLPPLAVQYMDYAAWQRKLLNAGSLARQLSYWQRELAGAPAALELPTDRPRPPVQTFRGTWRARRMPDDFLEGLTRFNRAHDATLYMTLLAAWQVLLHRYSGQDDIVVGSPLANRDRPELEPLIGCFVNNVVMRGRLEGNPRFVDYLEQVKGTVLRAFDHRELPFDRLVEALRPERSMSHAPIFQVLFTLHSFPIERPPQTGIRVELVELDELGAGSARFDIALDVVEREGELRMTYEYSTDLFDHPTIDRMHAQYVTLLQGILADARQTVREIPLLTEKDEREMFDRANATALEHDRSLRVHDAVRLMAERSPDAVAVEAEDERLTYEMLERRSNQLAHLLRSRGVGRGALVGVCLDRTSFLPVALLGVLKAGAAYVPVDPTHPAERLTYTLLDAEVACVITEERFTALVEAARVPLVYVDADRAAMDAQPAAAPEVAGHPSDLAYVIYTSGSTGRPKGVEIEHRHLVNLLHGMQIEPGIAAGDVLLAVTTPSFDIAGLELFLPLVSGARTVIASRGDTLDGERLRARLESCGATIMQATPATWRLLIDTGWTGAPGLTALCGGEVLTRDLARQLRHRVRAVWNMYGPTETTIWSTIHLVSDVEGDIPIGHPIANTTVYVLDGTGRAAPIGVAGELCIGGEGVARGYRKRDELTAEKFVTVTLAGRAPERVYRTGDVVRLRADLALEFVGRRDHQVKLRGYRIELGEIESVLAEHPSVKRAVVIVREETPGDPRLVAYVVPAEAGGADEDVLRTLLRERLPAYMVPSAIVSLEAVPLTPNGKVDRRALPAPAVPRRAAWAAQAVMTDTQRRVAEIWTAVLKTDRLGLTDNFFDLGGHSLLVIKVRAAMKRAFGVDVTVVDLFERTTVAAQAELLDGAAARNRGLERAQARVARQALV